MSSSDKRERYDAFMRVLKLIEDVNVDRYGAPLKAALELCNDLADENAGPREPSSASAPQGWKLVPEKLVERLKADAVMSKFATSRERQAYRSAVDDVLTLLQESPSHERTMQAPQGAGCQEPSLATSLAPAVAAPHSSTVAHEEGPRDRCPKCGGNARGTPCAYPEDCRHPCRSYIAERNQALIAAASARSATGTSQWIPVGTSDVPAEGHHVLVFNSHDECSYTAYTEGGKWRHACGNGSERYVIRGVTHWMPLPSVPSDGGCQTK